MRKFILTSLCLMLLALPGLGRSQDADTGGAIETVITGQIEAFLREDVEAAFEFASPNIKGLFGTSERFGAMVQSGYPMVWQPEEVRYLALRNVAGRLWQRVMITDGDGSVHLLDYQMVNTEMGWKINAVQLLSGDAAAA